MDDNNEKTNNKNCLPSLQQALESRLSHPVIRSWHSSDCFDSSQFVLPVFVHDLCDEVTPISSMKNVFRYGINRLEAFLAPLIRQGLKSILLFGVITDVDNKDVGGLRVATSASLNPVIPAIKLCRVLFPSLYIIADVCHCEYTSHGHCGLFITSDGLPVTQEESLSGRPHHAASAQSLAVIALTYAEAGADMVAPSDMMDHRVALIKKMLADAGYPHIGVMSYSAKYASCFYGPFRQAVQSAPMYGDRSSHQLPIASNKLGLLAAQRDIMQGADVIMVKPAGLYLDIISQLCHEHPHVPIAAYQVSGEYAMLMAAADAGVVDLDKAIMESLIAIKRSGATILITYFTPHLLQRWCSK